MSCFDCNTQACKNYGTCQSGICACPDGFGSFDCSKPVCGSIATLPSLRPVLGSGNCTCATGFLGPNCNICTNNIGCSNAPGVLVGETYICNSSPRPWAQKHESYCLVDNALISAFFPGQTALTINQNLVSASALGTLWIDNIVQFSCLVSDCAFSYMNGTQTSICGSIACSCSVGSQFCGGGTLDLTKSVDSATGGLVWTCHGQNCNLKFDFLADLLPTGIDLNSCVYGECVNSLANPGLDSTAPLYSIDTISVVGFAITGIFLLLVVGSLGFVLYEWVVKQRTRHVPEFQKVALRFSDLCYQVDSKPILRSVNGKALSGSLLAILGPSGAGKSTLLDILAGKSMQGTISGRFLVNRYEIPRSSMRSLAGYVAQEDVLFSSLTVREVLQFSAKLRLPESLSAKDRRHRVDEVLDLLSLTHIADSRIGNAFHRGISGGEKRRVSIGVELVTDPPILFLDEPTSGLDSYNASQVMKALSRLSKSAQKTVVCTIHQPRSDVFALFDHVLLLSAGQVVYAGALDKISTYLKAADCPCPEGYNMADHLLDLTSNDAEADGRERLRVDVEKHALESRKNSFIHTTPLIAIQRLSERDLQQSIPVSRSSEYLPQNIQESRMLLKETSDLAGIPTRRLSTSFINQFVTIFGRQMKRLLRSPGLFFFHVISNAILGVFLGGLYWHVDSSLAGIQNRLGSIFFLQSLIGFSGLSAIGTFSMDRLIYIRERSNKFYGSSPFFICTVLFDLIPLRIIPTLILSAIAYVMIGYTTGAAFFVRFVFVMVLFSCNCGLYCLLIGCCLNDFGSASLVASVSMLFHMLFAGILVNQVSIPAYIGWIQYLSFFKYAYEAVVVNDAISLKFVDTISGLTVTVPATLILAKFGIDINAFWRDVTISLGIMILLLISIGLVFRFKLKETR